MGKIAIHRSIFLLLLLSISFVVNAQSVFDSVVLENTRSYLPNGKITYALNYSEKNLNSDPTLVYSILLGLEQYLNLHSNIDRWNEYYYHMANYNFIVEKYDQANSYYNKALEQNFPLSNEQLAICYLNLSFIKLFNENIIEAKNYLQLASVIIQNNTDIRLKGMLYQQQALINVNEENYPIASSLYQRALSQYSSKKDSLKIASTYCDIAFMYVKIGNYPLAIDYLEKAGVLYQKINKHIYSANNYLKKSTVYIAAAQYNNALENLKFAEHLYTQINNQEKLIKTNNLKGKTLTKLRDFSKAKEALNNALSLNSNNTSKQLKQQTLLFFGDLYSEIGQIKKAQDYYLQCLHNISNTKTKLELYEKISHNYSKINDFKKAYKYQILFNGLQNTLLNDLNTKKVERLKSQLNFELTEHENKMLILQKELSILMEGKKNRNFLYQIIIFGLLLAVSTLIFLLLKAKKNYALKRLRMTQTIKNQYKKIQKSNVNYTKLKKTSDRILNIATKNMWEPYWVLDRLANEATDKENDKDINIEQFAYENDQLIMARNLIENVLFWAKLKQNIIEFHPELLLVDKLLYPILKTQNIRALAKQITLNYKQNTTAYIYANNESIKVALRNIVENAIKFSTIKGEVLIQVNSLNTLTEIIIHDNGVGMTNEQISSVFSVNSPYTASGTHGEKGIGLGLLLSKEFIDHNNGKLEFESSIAFGTSVKITLPAAKA